MAIKVFRSDQQGAPTLNGVGGTLVTVLDAVLVDGYGQVNVSSITRSSATATVTTASPHGLDTGDTVLIAGAVETAYNGEFIITLVNSTSFTYTVSGSPSTPATGTITSKRAPAGFTKTFSASLKAVYRSNDVSGLRHYYRFIDDGTTSGGAREARMLGYVTMSDIDTGTDQFPTAAQYVSGFFCQKSDTADSSGRQWVVVTDGKTVYFFSYIQSRTDGTTSFYTIASPGTNMAAFAFGDLIPFKTGDAYCSFTVGNALTNNFSSTQYSGLFSAATTITNATPSTSQGLIITPRDYTAVSGARAGQLFASGLMTSIGITAVLSYPHLVDNGFYMTPAVVTQGSPSIIRARMPGYFEPLHATCFPNGTIIDSVQGYTGRKFMMLYGKHSSSVGACMIDITGPWDS